MSLLRDSITCFWNSIASLTNFLAEGSRLKVLRPTDQGVSEQRTPSRELLVRTLQAKWSDSVESWRADQRVAQSVGRRASSLRWVSLGSAFLVV